MNLPSNFMVELYEIASEFGMELDEAELQTAAQSITTLTLYRELENYIETNNER